MSIEPSSRQVIDEQYRHYFTKPVPRSIVVFGASGRIGGPLAACLKRDAPGIRLRLATSRKESAAHLQATHPDAEVVWADYGNLSSLEAATAGMEGVFSVTPSATDEAIAMGNLVAALRKAQTAVHVIRQLGVQPDASQRRVPEVMKKMRLVLPIQHAIAREVLDASGLPVTFLNTGASFMDNFARWMSRGLREERALIWPQRRVTFIDTLDVGEVVCRLFLSTDRRHIGQLHTANNNHDFLNFTEIAEMMSEVWGERFVHRAAKGDFWKEYHWMGEARLAYLWELFNYERDNEVIWSRNDFVERLLGRKGTTMREWLIANRDRILKIDARVTPRPEVTTSTKSRIDD